MTDPTRLTAEQLKIESFKQFVADHPHYDADLARRERDEARQEADALRTELAQAQQQREELWKLSCTGRDQAISAEAKLAKVKALVQDRHLVLDCSALELADHIAEAIGLEGGLHS